MPGPTLSRSDRRRCHRDVVAPPIQTRCRGGVIFGNTESSTRVSNHNHANAFPNHVALNWIQAMRFFAHVVSPKPLHSLGDMALASMRSKPSTSWHPPSKSSGRRRRRRNTRETILFRRPGSLPAPHDAGLEIEEIEHATDGMVDQSSRLCGFGRRAITRAGYDDPAISRGGTFDENRPFLSFPAVNPAGAAPIVVSAPPNGLQVLS